MNNTLQKTLLSSVAGICLAAAPAVTAAQMAIDSLSGPITANEIASFKGYIATLTPGPTPWGAQNGTGHNEWADGNSGNALEALGLMYEATGDMEILNTMISWADKCTSERNDLLPASSGGHRVMWTGTIAKVWVPNDPTSSSATYAGGENGDTKAHIAYCALQILHTPSIWSTTVPDGDPFGYGATYLARAQNYVTRCDEGHDDYDHIFYTSAHLVRNPSNWPSGFHTMEANNIQMMLLGYLQRLAECHEILGDSPTRVSQYDLIVKTAATECINGMAACHPGTVSGHSVYAWCYYPWSVYPSSLESVGHAAYDMVGVWRAYNRSSYGFTLSKVKPFADALVYVMSKGGNNFSSSVDGTGTTQNYMQAQWLLLADWNSSVYDLVAGADLASGRYHTTTLMDASILWMKQRLYLKTGSWQIENVTSGKVLNQGGALTNGAPISQWTSLVSDNLKFTFVPASYGYYQIKSVKSSLDIVVSGASTANGALLVQWSLGSGGNDLWRAVPNSDGTWSFLNHKSGKAINNTGGSTANGTQYSQWTFGTSSNLKFTLLPQ
jgi:hypothetical protein